MIPVEYIDEILRGKWFDSDYASGPNAIQTLSDLNQKMSYQIEDWAEVHRLVDISSCIYAPTLSGYRFCDLRERKTLSPNDLFLISRLRSAYYDEMNNRVESPRSFNYTYHQLSTQMLHDTAGLFSVGTMSYMNWWDYSEVAHHHDLIYNSVMSVEVVNDYLQVNNTVSVMAIISTGLSTEHLNPYRTIELCCPADQYIPVEEPAIGSIRLCYKTDACIDGEMIPRRGPEWINSTEFDGWVMANGETYDSTGNCNGAFDFTQRFQKALTKLAGSANAKAFTVPKLNGFYKWTDYFHANSNLNYVHRGHTSLLPHTHFLSTETFQLDDSFASLNLIDTDTYREAQDLFTHPTMHAGRNKGDKIPLSLDTNLITIHSYLIPNSEDYSPLSGNTPQFSPSDLIGYQQVEGKINPIPTLEHDLIPALVYVGGHMKNYVLYEKYHNYRHRRNWEPTKLSSQAPTDEREQDGSYVYLKWVDTQMDQPVDPTTVESGELTCFSAYCDTRLANLKASTTSITAEAVLTADYGEENYLVGSTRYATDAANYPAVKISRLGRQFKLYRNYGGEAFALDVGLGQALKIETTPTSFTVNGVTTSIPEVEYKTITKSNLYLGSAEEVIVNETNHESYKRYWPGWIGRVTVKNGSSIVADLRPAKLKSTGKVGFYDVVRKQFYTSNNPKIEFRDVGL